MVMVKGSLKIYFGDQYLFHAFIIRILIYFSAWFLNDNNFCLKYVPSVDVINFIIIVCYFDLIFSFVFSNIYIFYSVYFQIWLYSFFFRSLIMISKFSIKLAIRMISSTNLRFVWFFPFTFSSLSLHSIFKNICSKTQLKSKDESNFGIICTLN